MSIGKTLTEARLRAGFTIPDVAALAQVREEVVRDIEQDSFESADDADGDIRSIADAVGTDPGSLINEYHEMLADAGSEAPRRWKMTLIALVVLFVGFGCYDLISNLSNVMRPDAMQAPAASRAAATHAAAPATATAASPSASPSRSPASATSPASAVRVLAVASATAFGPNGTSDGDHPEKASLSIDGDDGTAWTSSWYATAYFGDLKQGTGLLLDMGKMVTISSVRLKLGDSPGADVELRAGTTSELGSASAVATASDASGTVRLPLSSPVRARYLLIWFTKLPPTGSGQYQASVYTVAVTGHS